MVSDYKSAYDGTVEAVAKPAAAAECLLSRMPLPGHGAKSEICGCQPEAISSKNGPAHTQPLFLGSFCATLRPGLEPIAGKQPGQWFAAVEASIGSLLSKAAGSNTPQNDPVALWSAALTQTYRTEWRSEDESRAREIVAANRNYYETAAFALYGEQLERLPQSVSPGAPPKMRYRLSWFARRLSGRGLSILRLIKAAYTFQGGADYLAWKIQRHSGVALELTGWQRRHPVLAGLWLLPKLYRKRMVR